jgi:hypothetical protein
VLEPVPVLVRVPQLDWVRGSVRERELERVRDCQLVWKGWATIRCCNSYDKFVLLLLELCLRPELVADLVILREYYSS